MRTLVPIIVTVTVLLGVSALATTVLLATASANPSIAPVLVDERTNNAMLDLRIGQVMELVLPENLTAGYSWTLTLADGLDIETDEYRSIDRGSTNSAMAGAGGDHARRFRAAYRGTCLVQGSNAHSREITPEDRSCHRTLPVE